MSQSNAKQPDNSETPESPADAALLPAEVQRFDIHQRLQHASMAIAFIVLVLTGWPLSTHGYGVSQFLISLFGGLEGCALVHRIAAVVLIAAGIYHVVYLAVLLKRRELSLSMIAGPKDAKDLFHNLLFFFGLRKERPRFPKFSYFEKFDYWAVFWGVVIMVVSGLIRWFPDDVLKVLPAWAYEMAYFAHADEALLAALAIFVWHFYNVHLRPAVFPMSWVFITGRMTLAEFREEHRAEYDAMVARAARDTAETPEA